MSEDQAKETTLDHIDKIIVPGDVFREPANEYWGLLCLWEGMEYIYKQAAKCDDGMRQRVNPDGKYQVAMFGRFDGLPAKVQALLTCSFHWYAVSACNYARTVGAIAYRQDQKRPLPPEYVERAMPEVKAFRDKIAAHYAWSTNNAQDNEAERAFSVFPALTFENDSFYVGGQTLRISRSGKASSSEAISRWSIVSTHKQLRRRYWPAGGEPNETGKLTVRLAGDDSITLGKLTLG